ncbi:Pancreatic lipase-related protein 2 [Varanus komodoensis]|nr:Pancreatic lipase-related protein 2 [Varanus komodoensis]
MLTHLHWFSWRIHVSVKLIGTPTLRGNITLAFTGNNNVRRQYPVASGFFYPSHRYARFLNVDISGNFIAVEFQ